MRICGLGFNLAQIGSRITGRALYDRPLQSCGNGCDGRPIPAPSEVLLPAVAVRAVRFWSLNRDGPAPISNGPDSAVAPISRLTARLEPDRFDVGPLTTKWPHWYRMVRTIICFTPILFCLSPHGITRRVLHLNPIGGPTCGRRSPCACSRCLRGRACRLPEDRLTVVAFNVLVEAEPSLDWRQQNAARWPLQKGRWHAAACDTRFAQ
jgi:hypothetical protein